MSYIDTEYGQKFLKVAKERFCDISIPEGYSTGSPHVPAEAWLNTLASAAVQIAMGTSPDNTTGSMIITRCMLARRAGEIEAAAWEQGINGLRNFVQHLATPTEDQRRLITQVRLDEATSRLELFDEVFPGCFVCDHFTGIRKS